MSGLQTIQYLSSLDREHRKATGKLATIFSEKTLITRRIKVEGEYLIKLSEMGQTDVRIFSQEEKDLIRTFYHPTDEDIAIVKAIETEGYKGIPKTDHDVKAVELFIKLRLAETSLKDSVEWVHFALTSEDDDNIAYGTMLNDCKELIADILNQADPNDSTLKEYTEELRGMKLSGKLAGAVGNFNAHYVAYPDVNWIDFSQEFVSQFGLEPSIFNTQVESKDSYAELFQIMERINNYLKEKRVNKNTEKNLDLSKALFRHLAKKLPTPRLQRDLSDSTVRRNIGVAFGYALAAISETYPELGVDLSTQENVFVSPLDDRYYKEVKPLEEQNTVGDAVTNVYLPALDKVITHLRDKSKEYAAMVMLARTHGQAALGTTLGKEEKVFHKRLEKQRKKLYELATSTKTDYDKDSKIFQTMVRTNNILEKLDTDFWRYISDDWLLQKPDETTGSSTMPQKINPIKFENSEGNAGMANVFLNHYVDYRDSDWREGMGYSLLAATNTMRGLSKITPNVEKMKQTLTDHPEIISEAYQTILRREGLDKPFELLKKIVRDTERNRKITLEDLHTFVDGLPVPDSVKNEMKAIIPDNYVGVAELIAHSD